MIENQIKMQYIWIALGPKKEKKIIQQKLYEKC